MTGELILITGVSGFVGFRALIQSLTQGYRVRAVVRADTQIPKIKKAVSNIIEEPKVEFLVVEDLTNEKSFDDALVGVDFIFHNASPMKMTPSDDYQRDYFSPAVDMCISVLSAASKVSTVKRIVVLSSIGALIDTDMFLQGTLKQEPYKSNDQIPSYPKDKVFAFPLLAYGASKAKALSASEDWIESNKPSYDVVFVLPSTIIGPHQLAETVEAFKSTTNAPLITLVQGVKSPLPGPGAKVHIHDVVDLLLGSIKKENTVKAGRYLASGPSRPWMETIEIIKKYFPEEVKNGTLSLEGVLGEIRLPMDVSDTEEAFGLKFQGFEAQVKDAVTFYLGLSK